jgi:hypothetical protein
MPNQLSKILSKQKKQFKVKPFSINNAIIETKPTDTNKDNRNLKKMLE